MKNLYVGNLSPSTSDAELRSAFEAHGKVDKVSIVMDRETGRARGFAFVEMSDATEADKAVAALGCACSFAMSSRVRVRRAIFCLRSTLNLDLSPLTPDICCLLFAAELHVLKLQHAHPRPEREKSALAGIYLAARPLNREGAKCLQCLRG